MVKYNNASERDGKIRELSLYICLGTYVCSGYFITSDGSHSQKFRGKMSHFVIGIIAFDPVWDLIYIYSASNPLTNPWCEVVWGGVRWCETWCEMVWTWTPSISGRDAFHTTSHHLTPHHTISHHLTLLRTTSHHTTLSHTTPHHLPSHNIMLTLPSTFGIFDVLSGLGRLACKM